MASLNLHKVLVTSALLLLVGCGGGGGDTNGFGQPVGPTLIPTPPSDDANPGSGPDSTGQPGPIIEPTIDPQPLSTTNLPALKTLTDDSFLIGTTILGQMRIYNPFSGQGGKFSDLADIGSFVQYKRSVEVVDDLIISIADDNTLNAIDIRTGDYLWDINLGSFGRAVGLISPAPPVCDAGICYVMGAFGDLVAIDIRRGTTIWNTPLFPNDENPLRTYRLLVTKDRIFSGAFRFSSVSGDVEPTLYAVSRETGAIEKRLPPGRATLAGDLLLISGEGLHAYDFDTLEPVWFNDLNLVSDATVVGDIVVVNAAEKNTPIITAQRVIGLNRLDGSILWSQQAGTAQSIFTPTTDGRLIYTGFGETCSLANCVGGYPMALNPADGSIVWTNDSVTLKQEQAPVVVEGHLFYNEVFAAVNINGDISFPTGPASLDSSDGSIDWVSLDGPTFFSLTAIINGVAVRSIDHPSVMSTR